MLCKVTNCAKKMITYDGYCVSCHNMNDSKITGASSSAPTQMEIDEKNRQKQKNIKHILHLVKCMKKPLS